MEYTKPQIAIFAKPAVKLLQGPVFEDQEIWQAVVRHHPELAQYFEKIALGADCR